MQRDFSKTRRVVIKIGTRILTNGNGIDDSFIERIAGQIATIRKRGLQVLLVSSGAIGIGAQTLGMAHKITKIRMRQACAAIGQPLLMHRYRLAFGQYDTPIAQFLVTRDVLNKRESSVNLQNTLESLLNMDVLPIFNENDCISISEIGHTFGDNDQLSAHIASKLDADLLLVLSDIDALYDKDPQRHRDARPIHLVPELTEEIVNGASEKGSVFSTGGMKTKLLAVSIARQAGCSTVLAHGRVERVIPRILDGEELGTLFCAAPRLKNRTRWILNSAPMGRVITDDGAERALEERGSLLPAGIRSVEGEFKVGDVILINDRFKAVSGLSSTDIRKIAGCHSKEVTRILGTNRAEGVARSSDIVRLDNPITT